MSGFRLIRQKFGPKESLLLNYDTQLPNNGELN